MVRSVCLSLQLVLGCRGSEKPSICEVHKNEEAFSFGDKSSLPVTSSMRDGFGLLRREKRTVARSSQEGYTIRDKDLRNIHRAACLGDVEKVHHLAVVKKNSINSRDKMHRTALHLACATGHPDVVSFLADRNCQLNLYDQEARTPLMKAVQCQEESCVTILLEHGADPNCMDYNGNTALHYAAAGQNVSIVEKLLSYDVDIEGRNKEDLTPFLVAVAGNKQQIVEFLMERGANIHAIDIYNRTALMLAVTYECTDIVKLLLQKGINIFLEAEWGWTAEEYATINGFNVIRQLIAEHREAIRAKNCSQNRNPAVDESSEDTLRRLSVFRGNDDARPTSVDGNVNIKNVPKPSLIKLMAACEKFKNLETKRGLMTVGDKLSLTDDNSDHKDEDTKVHDLFCPEIPSANTLKKPLRPLEGLGVTKDGEVLSAIGEKDNGIDTESAPREQTVNDNLTSADRASKNNGDVMVIGLGEEEDRESPWHSEPIVEVKASVRNKTIEIKKKDTSKSDLSAERNLEMTSEEEQERQGERENNHLQMVEERKRHESDKLAVSESIYAAAAPGLIQQTASGKTDNHLCPIMEDEDSDGPAKKTSKEKKEIKKQINFTDDLDDLTPSSGTASEDCKLPCFDFRSCMLLIEQLGMDCKDSVNLLKIRNAVCSFERLLELKNDHCEQLTRKNKELENWVNGLQKELSQTKEIKLQLEQQKVEWEQELCSLRFSFKREKEKRRNTDMLYEKIKEQLKRKVQQYNKEAELKQQLEVTLRTRDEELRTVRNNLNQLQEAQDRHAEAVRCIEKSKDHVQKPEVENAELKDRVKKQAGGIEELQENLLSTSSCDDKRGEMKKFIELKQSLEYCLDQEVKKNGQLEKEITRLKKLLSMTRSEVDDLTAKLETASSKCLQLDEKNQVLSQKLLSMKELQKKCEKLEKDKKKLEQQVVNLKSHAELNMAEYSRIEQYKRELDKRARLDMEEKLREVNLFLQAQVASQESLGQLRDSNNALISSQMELRVKDLEFELSKMKSSQEHSHKTELEKYKELYFEEVKVRTSLTNELNRTNERLAEIRTKLLVEKQQKRNFLHTVTMSPVLELPYVRNISNRLPLDRYVAPRENVMIPPSSSCPSNNGIESYLLKVQKEFEKRISRELKAAAAELESDSSYYTSSFF